MGKSFGVNSKAQEGRERKEAQKTVKRQKEAKEREEREARAWEVGAKAPSARQLDDDRRREERTRQKLERARQVAAEEAELEKLRPVRPLPKEKSRGGQPRPVSSPPSPSAPPHRPAEAPQLGAEALVGTAGHGEASTDNDGVPEYSASNIDDALFLLDPTSTQSLVSTRSVERHPERRIKAAYAAFEEREMPELKREFPGLRLTQLREKLQRAWHKSPDNPFNQAHISYNATRSQEYLKASGEVESNLERLRLSPR